MHVHELRRWNTLLLYQSSTSIAGSCKIAASFDQPKVPTHIPYYHLYDWEERSAVACTLVDLRGEHNDVIGSKTYALECYVLKVLHWQSCELPASRCRVCFVAVWPVACGTSKRVAFAQASMLRLGHVV